MQQQNCLNIDENDAEKFYDCNDAVSSDQNNCSQSSDFSKECSKVEVEKAVKDENLSDMQKLQLNDKEEQQLLKEASILKEKGNFEFRKQFYVEAEALYSEGLRICPDCCSSERSKLYSNRSACLMHLDKKEEAILDCSEALRLNPIYLKALLRRAQLYADTEKLDEALDDYKKVLEIHPSNCKAKTACIQLPPLIEARNERLKKEMMNNLKDLGNKVLGKFGLSTDNFQLQQNPETGSYNIQFKQKP